MRPRAAVLFVVLACLSSVSVSNAQYDFPTPLIEALHPKGLRVSIPDSDGVQLFAFHGNVNKPLYNLEAGEMSVDITRERNGRWTYVNAQRRLKPGDVINFWLYVQVDGRGYRLDDQTFQVRELVDPITGLVPVTDAGVQTQPTQLPVWPNTDTANGGFNSFTNNQPSLQIPNNQGFTNPQNPFVPPSIIQNPFIPQVTYPNRPSNNYPDNVNVNRPSNNYPDNVNVNRPSNNYPDNVNINRPTNNYPDNVNVNRPTNNYPDNFNVNNRPTNNYPDTVNVNRPTNNYPDTVNRPSNIYPNNQNPNNNGFPNNQNVNNNGFSNNQNLNNNGFSNNQNPNPLPTPLNSGTHPSHANQDCVRSKTTVNGREACKGDVVFEESWNTLDIRRWEREIKISGHPDFEFCIYAQHQENSWVNNGRLHLKPSLTEDKYGADFVRTGKLELDDCTAGPANSESCSREAKFSYILPPTLSARLHTAHSFSFKYGILEVRAKLPQGDWIYPELWLLPRNNTYGPGLSSGRVHLAMARGNRDLRSPAGEVISGKRLEVGVLAGGSGIGSAGARKKFFHRQAERGVWGDQFHNYTLLWTPETLVFSVDGVELGVARPEQIGGVLHTEGTRVDPWAQGSRIAPFDQEFYISLGVAVGGIHAFPDESRSSRGVEKPWKNTAPKAMLSFWNAKDNWYPTWGENSQLIVESVRVTALNN